MSLTGSAPAHRWLIVLPYLLWGAALTYVLSFLDLGWIPSDEGILAQAAEQVLLGELPPFPRALPSN